jgi:hypothetical protein
MPRHEVKIQSSHTQLIISIDGIPTSVTPHDLRRSYARNLFLAGIPTEVIRQNLGHADVKTTQDYIGVLDGSTRAPVSVYDASVVLMKMKNIPHENRVDSLVSPDVFFATEPLRLIIPTPKVKTTKA